MSVKIGVGLGLGPPPPVEQYWRFIQLCETLVIDRVWHSDQLLRPSLEPMSMLAAPATATQPLRFGMNAMVLSHRDPLIIAKECATIDYLAPGRLLAVFGVGDSADPVWKAAGRSPKGRGQRANEAFVLIRRLLSEEHVSFQGEYFQYENLSIAPRPARRIPMWIGGESEAAIQRTAALGDGWLGGLTTPKSAGEVVARIKTALTNVGRQIEEDHYGVVVPFRIGAINDLEVVSFRNAITQRRGPAAQAPIIAVGDPAAIVSVFRQYVDAGISKFVSIPLGSGAPDLHAQVRRLAEEISPEVEPAERRMNLLRGPAAIQRNGGTRDVVRLAFA
jgi:probable F420-dependent oxidoreductase